MSVNRKVGPIRIHQVHKLPAPYSDIFFQALGNHPDLDFHVHYLWRGSWRRPWKSKLGRGYNHTYMKPVWGLDWGLLKTAWREVDSLFIVGDWAHLPTVAVILARWRRGAPVAIWTDAPQEEITRPVVKKWLRSKFITWLLPKVDIVFGTGKKALRLLLGMGARPAQLINLPYLVDLHQPIEAGQNQIIRKKAQELRERIGCDGNGIAFSLIGTLMKIKGQEIGLQAFARCRREADIPLGLLIAGEGPERQNLESLVNNLGLDKSVAFLGWQEPEEMDAVYLASDIVLHPARVEPHGLVILETMNWSKVIISSDSCGASEDRVIHGVNGFSFPTEDVGELAGIMLDLVRHPEKLPEIGAQARKTAEAWPVERGVEVVLEQAQKVLSKGRKYKHY
jgi:glycosyltransferase involved in cell wall biosynthesis